jgi:hypothetical protein
MYPVMKKIGFVSLGCPKNLVDSEVMMGQLKESGYEITTNASEADTLVVNTCGFIDSAKKESVDAILEAARLKTEGKCQRLVVAGCLVERYRDELRAEMPEVDAFIGTNQINDITSVCDEKLTRVHCLSCNSAIKARRIFTTNRRRECSQRRVTAHISRLRKVVIARALLFYSADARSFSQPPFWFDHQRSAKLGIEGRQRADTRRAGFVALRRRLGRKRRARSSLARAVTS